MIRVNGYNEYGPWKNTWEKAEHVGCEDTYFIIYTKKGGGPVALYPWRVVTSIYMGKTKETKKGGLKYVE